MNITGQVQSGVPAFRKALADYAKQSRRDLGTILFRKGNDFRIKLVRGFKRVKAKRIPGQARKLRYAILPTHAVDEATLARIRTTARSKKDAKRSLSSLRKRAQKEIKARRRSTAYLAAAFVAKGWRGGQGLDTELTVKQEGRLKKLISRFRLRTRPGTRNPSVRITSTAEGAAEIGESRGIIRQAEQEAALDIQTFLARRQGARAARILKKRFSPRRGFAA